MTAYATLRFAQGDTLIITGKGGARRLLTVLARKRTGYLLRSNDGADDQVWPHQDIYDQYVAGRLEHFRADLLALGSKLSATVQADWERWPEPLRCRARRREQYCLYVDRLIRRGVAAGAAYPRAAITIFRRNERAWTDAETGHAARAAALRHARRRKAAPIMEARPVVALKRPSPYSVKAWYLRWVSAGRDVRALIDQFHNRGDRQPRKPCRLHLQVDEAEPLCVYGAMRYIARTIYMRFPRVPITYAYTELRKHCAKAGLDPISYTGFRDFLKRHYTDFEEYRARFGAKAAYYKFHLFERRQAPERPLEEVEVDHTLLDVFVLDQRGRKGRPWLTLLICRATRCIVGLHIGFEPPCYATLQRAVVHAICPKDLRGLPDVKHQWPCHGVMEAIITDRGREFLSESFFAAGRDVGFAIVNLPGRCPYLKGAVERFFGTLNVRVLSRLEGTTISRTPEAYDPQARARLTLAQLTGEIVRWIVDDYHQHRHKAIGCSPAEKWADLVDKHGVRPINSVQRLIVLMGEKVRRRIGNTGIQWEGRTYSSPELELLRQRRGGLDKEWEVRCDPYDRGQVWVLEGDGWLCVPAVHQQTAAGITKFAARIHTTLARRLVAEGEPITDAVMVEAKRLADAAAERGPGRRKMRYHADGALATGVMSDIGIPSLVGRRLDAPARLDPGHAPAITAPRPGAGQVTEQGGAFARLLRERLDAVGRTPA